MYYEIFVSLPIVLLCFGVTFFMLAFSEIGYRFGLHAHTRQNQEGLSSLGPMVGALLAMLGFVLAITFSMASSQHDLRKKNVLEDANAIGTAYLRADLLDHQYQGEVKQLLREYVDVRLGVAQGDDIEPAMIRTSEIHSLLWTLVSAAAFENPTTNTSLMIDALNAVIDVHEKRVVGALHTRIPVVVWIALAAITALTMLALGAQVGSTGKRSLFAVLPLILAFAVLVTLVLDLNRPQNGFLKVGQQSMLSLQASMSQRQ